MANKPITEFIEKYYLHFNAAGSSKNTRYELQARTSRGNMKALKQLVSI